MEGKIVHFIDNQYIKEYLTPIKYFFMHNLWSNFYLFLDITKSAFKSSVNADGNFRFIHGNLYLKKLCKICRRFINEDFDKIYCYNLSVIHQY